MAKFKLAGRRQKTTAPQPVGGIPCMILLALAFILIMFFLYYVMKNAAIS